MGSFTGPYVNGYFKTITPFKFDYGVDSTANCNNINATNYNINALESTDCYYSLKSPQEIQIFFWYETPDSGGEDTFTILYETPVYGCGMFGARNYNSEVTNNVWDMCEWWSECNYEPNMVPDCNDDCFNSNLIENILGNENCDDGNNNPPVNLRCERWGYDCGDCGDEIVDPYGWCGQTDNIISNRYHDKKNCYWIDCENTPQQKLSTPYKIVESLYCYGQECFDMDEDDSVIIEHTNTYNESVLITI